MDKDNPFTVCVREYATGQEVEVNILKAFVDPIILPSVISLSGPDAQRQWYLLNEAVPIVSTRKAVQNQLNKNFLSQ